MFLITGGSNTLIGKEIRKINSNGLLVNAEVKVYKSYISLFFLPIIPIGKRYSIYIPHTDEYYESSYLSKMPEKYLEVCKEVGRKY